MEKTIKITHEGIKELLRYPPIFRIAREDIARADICTVLWNRFCRRADKGDVNIGGFAFQNYKKGEEVMLLRRMEVELKEFDEV